MPFDGTSFGELSLQNDKPRAATVIVKSDTATMIVISKRNYKRVLDYELRQQDDQAIAKLRQFDLFKQMTKLKMSNMRFYFKEKKFIRGSYLFRQGDLINGVFCIMEGEARLVKETWKMTNDTSSAPPTRRSDEGDDLLRE